MRFTADKVCQRYGSNDVLKDVSFTASLGDVVALLGPNGSGKSTLIRTLSNLMPPKAGRVSIGDRDVACIEVGPLDIGTPCWSDGVPMSNGPTPRRIWR